MSRTEAGLNLSKIGSPPGNITYGNLDFYNMFLKEEIFDIKEITRNQYLYILWYNHKLGKAGRNAERNIAFTDCFKYF